jgi:hypothetical protein
MNAEEAADILRGRGLYEMPHTNFAELLLSALG